MAFMSSLSYYITHFIVKQLKYCIGNKLFHHNNITYAGKITPSAAPSSSLTTPLPHCGFASPWTSHSYFVILVEGHY